MCDMPEIDADRVAMIGLSYGGYFTLHTMAADNRIKAGYCAGVFNDRDVYDWADWSYRRGIISSCKGAGYSIVPCAECKRVVKCLKINPKALVSVMKTERHTRRFCQAPNKHQRFAEHEGCDENFRRRI